MPSAGTCAKLVSSSCKGWVARKKMKSPRATAFSISLADKMCYPNGVPSGHGGQTPWANLFRTSGTAVMARAANNETRNVKHQIPKCRVHPGESAVGGCLDPCA